MIIVDAINDCLERVDAVDRVFRIILCINRYKLAINYMSIVPNQILLTTVNFQIWVWLSSEWAGIDWLRIFSASYES